MACVNSIVSNRGAPGVTVILAAGQSFSSEEYGRNMTPIRGKPAIAWVAEGAAAGGRRDDIRVVLDAQDKRTISYLRQAYPKLELVETDPDGALKKYGSYSILTSLAEGLSRSGKADGRVRVVLGDTLCMSAPDADGDDFILVSSDFDDSDRWCLVEADDKRRLKAVHDKQSGLDAAGKYAVIGVYQFGDGPLLSKLLAAEIKSKRTQLSDLFAAYNSVRPMLCLPAETWIDLGHRRGLVKARTELYNARGFNSISADVLRGKIRKTSADVRKISDEHAWFANVPDEIKALCPRVYGFETHAESASLTMEMYGYPALSELFILGNFSIEEWKLIIERLFEIHRLISSHAAPGVPVEDFHELYIGKTFRRIEQLLAQNPYWEKLYGYDRIIINDIEYDNIRVLEDRFRAALEDIAKSAKPAVMHGDFQFANILFDTNHFMCRLVDPRGRIRERTIYGDPRYDAAKLRHSAVGEYNFATHGLFTVSEEGNRFAVSVLGVPFQAELTAFFDDMILKNGYDPREIRIIEAMLFASMIPLHDDDMQRQKLFYLKAVQKLNECFGMEEK